MHCLVNLSFDFYIHLGIISDILKITKNKSYIFITKKIYNLFKVRLMIMRDARYFTSYETQKIFCLKAKF